MKQWTIKRLRDEHNLTQQQMADKLGISVYSYSRKENGITSFLDYEMFAVREIFNKPVDEIFLNKNCNYIAK